MKATHTPLPWRIQYGLVVTGPRFVAKVYDFSTETTSYTSENVALREEAQANAELIVRACNAHEDLLAALDRLLSAFESDKLIDPDITIRTSWETNGGAIQEAKAALSKARGQGKGQP